MGKTGLMSAISGTLNGVISKLWKKNLIYGNNQYQTDVWIKSLSVWIQMSIFFKGGENKKNTLFFEFLCSSIFFKEDCKQEIRFFFSKIFLFVNIFKGEWQQEKYIFLSLF